MLRNPNHNVGKDCLFRVGNHLDPEFSGCRGNDRSEEKLSFGTQLCQNLKRNGRSMAIALLSSTMSLQLGVTEVQADSLERHMWGASAHPTVQVDNQRTNLTFTNSNKKQLFHLAASGATCEETYGFLPCSTSVGGNLFLMSAYGYLLFLAAKFISDGSELLLEVGMAPAYVHNLRYDV
jgi:hypothetical protein